MNEALLFMPESSEFLELDFIPNVIRVQDVSRVPNDSGLTKEIADLMTPEEVLRSQEFVVAEPISLIDFPTFGSLVSERERIRRLTLLPVKSEVDNIRYHHLPKELLIQQVEGNLGDSPFALAYNLYRYYLPDDLTQRMLWMRDPKKDVEEIAGFMAKCSNLLNVSPEDLILFERPLNISTRLVRGTFPEFRHIHYWSRLTPLD